MIPAAASAMVPYADTAIPQAEMHTPDLSGLASTIARAIAERGDRPQPEQEIRVYLDWEQLSSTITQSIKGEMAEQQEHKKRTKALCQQVWFEEGRLV